jgi:superfamily II DNA or RNA helicase
MRLEIDNSWTRVTSAAEAETQWLDDYLKFEDNTLDYLARKRKKEDRPTLALYRNGAFPSGLVSLVRKGAAAEGFGVESAQVGTGHALRPNTETELGWLDELQMGAVKAGWRAHRGLIWVSTGGGKTEIGIGLVASIEVHWLVLVHRRELMHQFADRYRLRTGNTAGMIGDGKYDPDPNGIITIATYQTVYKMLREHRIEAIKLFGMFGGFIADEAHTAGADSMFAVLMALRGCHWRFGLSGTPLARGDRRSTYTIGAIGPVIYRVKAAKLIETGRLAKPIIRMVECHQEVSDKKTWAAVYREKVVGSKRRNKLLVAMVKMSPKPCLVFVQHIKHGKALLAAFQKAGIKAAFAWGDLTTTSRRADIKRLEFGELDVLIASVIFNEGIDIPSLASVVLGSAGKSAIAALQRVGRGLRATPDKKYVWIFDVWDVGQPMLERHARARLRAFRGEDYETHVMLSHQLGELKDSIHSSGMAPTP